MARTETVTVVFTDLVRSTELASRLGHDAYEALRHDHFAALRAAVAAHNGRPGALPTSPHPKCGSSGCRAELLNPSQGEA